MNIQFYIDAAFWSSAVSVLFIHEPIFGAATLAVESVSELCERAFVKLLKAKVCSFDGC